MVNSVVYVISDYAEPGTNSEDRLVTMRVLKEFVGDSKIVSKVFKAKCIEILSSQKKEAKHYHFNMLRYSLVFAKRGKELNKSLEDSRCQKRKKGMGNCGI